MPLQPLRGDVVVLDPGDPRFEAPVVTVVAPRPRTGSAIVVVRIHPTARMTFDPAGAQDAAIDQLTAAIQLLAPATVRRRIRSKSPAEIAAIEEVAAASPSPPTHSLLTYFEVDLRSWPTLVPAAIAVLGALPSVDIAFEAGIPVEASVVYADEPFIADQEHLEASWLGVGAKWLWDNLPTCDGAGIRFGDVERRWNTAHEDLAGIAFSVECGANAAPDAVNVDHKRQFNHGTNTLGVVVARDNALGVIGLAPGVTSVGLSSLLPALGSVENALADCVTALVGFLGAGDVLLIEEALSGGHDPAETDPDVYTAITVAVGVGITVVEPAGNKSGSLDTLSTMPATDSGAIVVSAALNFGTAYLSGGTDARYGARVDAWAPSAGVATTGSGDLSGTGWIANDAYTNTFGDTSAAAAVVAGVCVLLQHLAVTYLGAPLLPSQLRALIRGYGTAKDAADAAAEPMGLMPDLEQIVTVGMGLRPDVYVRDFVGDDGSSRPSGVYCHCPDVIVRPAAVVDPDASFGESSGTVNDETLADTVESGQDNYVYVRVRNRGNLPATDVRATVYWAEASTVVVPTSGSFTAIGTSAPLSVPADDLFVVLPPISWTHDKIPPAGSAYCLVVVLDHALDPAPVDWAAALLTHTDFLQFVSTRNNVGWHNFQIVNLYMDIPEFRLAAFARARTGWSLGIQRALPRGADVWIELPAAFAAQVSRRTGWPLSASPREGVSRLALPRVARLLAPGLPPLPAGGVRARIVVSGEGLRPGHGVRVHLERDGVRAGGVAFVHGTEAQLRTRGLPVGAQAGPGKADGEPRDKRKRKGRHGKRSKA